MPLRSFAFTPLRVNPRLFPQRQCFHSSAFRPADSRTPNHYETLGVPVDASPGDIKKSFYALSKAHHPDLHPTDPDASTRFVAISTAYATIGNASKRTIYDRDVLRLHERSQSPFSHSSPRGSYSSTSSPAGGRPASGLSRRRTQFRGPPPSFYRNGAWGAHSAKRQKAQEDTGADPNTTKDKSSYTSEDFAFGKAGADAWASYGAGDDIPHFDRHGHTRTQREQDRRRMRRMAAERVASEGGGNMLVNFLLVGGTLLFGIFAASLFVDDPFGSRARRRAREARDRA